MMIALVMGIFVLQGANARPVLAAAVFFFGEKPEGVRP